MKRLFVSPVCTVLEIDATDILTASGEVDFGGSYGDDDGLLPGIGVNK